MIWLKRIGLKAPVSDYPKQRMETLGEKAVKEWKERGHMIHTNGEGKKLKVNYTFYEDSKNHIMYDKVKDIKCPVLIIHEDADKSVNIEDSKKLVKGFPNAKLIILKGADHGLEINGDISKHLKLFGDWFEKGEVNETAD